MVKVATAESRTVTRAMMVTGSLLPDETTTVSAEVPGRVARDPRGFGQPVKKGQVVAELDTTELQLQLDRVKGRWRRQWRGWGWTRARTGCRIRRR